jgi:hypothetical protein
MQLVNHLQKNVLNSVLNVLFWFKIQSYEENDDTIAGGTRALL